MDPTKVARTARRVTEARARLVRDYPFFGSLTLGLQFACAPCGTACTDGRRLIMDPDFVEQMKTDREVEFVILHEVLHCVLEHLSREVDRNHELFNIACDIVVNSTILEMWGLSDLRVADQKARHRTPLGDEGSLYSAEEVYQMLLAAGEDSDPGEDCPPGEGFGTIDRHDVWQKIPNKEEISRQWNHRIQNAIKGGYGSGNNGLALPPAIRRLTEELASRGKVNWKQVLHDFLQFDSFDYSFLPPDRRFSDGDFFLPAYNVDMDQVSARGIWICVDTSGSIDDEQLRDAMTEIQDAMRQVGLTGSISFFDHRITEPEEFTSENEFRKITPSGGGGTSFEIIFQYMQEHMQDNLPRAILIFTDGFADMPAEEEAMEVPVLWLIQHGGDTQIPWGRVIEIPE